MQLPHRVRALLGRVEQQRHFHDRRKREAARVVALHGAGNLDLTFLEQAEQLGRLAEIADAAQLDLDLALRTLLDRALERRELFVERSCGLGVDRAEAQLDLGGVGVGNAKKDGGQGNNDAAKHRNFSL